MKQLIIGEKTSRIPLIQGGMGVGVSLSGLASAVANCGGIGTISGVQIGFREPDFGKDPKGANIRALQKEIRRARELSPDGILAVNLMVPIENYKEMVKTAVEEGIDLIISGAGLPSDLPSLVKGTKTKAAPIVSSGKAAAVITKLWSKRHNYVPDLIIAEGPLAGGHLGFPMDVLKSGNLLRIPELIAEVKKALVPMETDLATKIPVVAAGGIFSRSDVEEALSAGADGVQMGTRFVATDECDADIRFKKAYVDSSIEDIGYVKSPVGMPGQAILNDFVKRVALEREKVTKCYNCLEPCNPATTQYCITNALIRSVTGDTDNGLIFIGKKGYLIDKIISVKQLIEELFS
ncbi:MAG: nitronate monooxygenase family protein [Gudongella sp.]|jgi:NAD(P)H-dependent flavin oxidoreductase YrpB (nitropropane dioxygenase family)|nr:nitronate monooxygenase family protein [Gudongella sp.]